MHRVLACALVATTSTATAAPTEDRWLDTLATRVIVDLAAGNPLVVEIHVPLCDNAIIRCGNDKLGDGDNPDTNLIWSTTPGFGAWFERRGNGWKRVLHQRGTATGQPDVVAFDVHRRTMRASQAWKKRGAPSTFDVVLVVRGWRGKAIDAALAQYTQDISGGPAREIVLADKSKIQAGGSAQLVAFVGHNRLMDVDAYRWPKPGQETQGTIAIACRTEPYWKTAVGEKRVPLLLTTDLLFANAAPLEAAVLAFASGQGYARIRAEAAAAYAAIRKRPVDKIFGAFTNPSDARWKR